MIVIDGGNTIQEYKGPGLAGFGLEVVEYVDGEHYSDESPKE